MAGSALRSSRAPLPGAAQLQRGPAGRGRGPLRAGPSLPAHPTETWTYGDVLRRANQAAQVFADDFGLVPGNRVLLRGPNNPWLVAAWFGVLRAGGVAVTTMPLLRAREITALT
ncbi:MAG TPA: AMP-binding protein, partial [Streptosporangiaceae bacterium]|nr:AMP-binding protein [Streptosporangiaceae bacterium]